jgi:hypothetical protein
MAALRGVRGGLRDPGGLGPDPGGVLETRPQGPARPLARAPEPELFSDVGARHFLHRIQQARVELKRVLREAVPPRIAAQLEALPDLEKRALALIARLEELSRYLSDKNLRGLRNEADRLQRTGESSTRVRLREEYERAQFALRGELTAIEEIAAAKICMMARLETMVGALEMFPCEIVRLRVIEADLKDNADETPFRPTCHHSGDAHAARRDGRAGPGDGGAEALAPKR